MKKIMKSRIFLIVLLCIISCGIGVYAATTYKASDVLYTLSNGTSMNVNDALNELYDNYNKYNYSFYPNGTAIYYNPETNQKCNASEAVSTTGTKTGCMKWYAFNDDSDSLNVNMILDHNTTALVAWNSSGSNSEMRDIAIYLVNNTKGWKVPARLITANEIAKITKNTNFNETTATTSNWFLFDSNNQTQTVTTKGESNYAWLFDYTYECADYGCNIEDNNMYSYGSSTNNVWGYWTSTITYGSSNLSWYVYRFGGLNTNHSVANGSKYGIRPVITVSKSILK